MEEASHPSHPSRPSRPSRSSRQVAASTVEQLAQDGSEDIGAIRDAVNDWLALLEGDAAWFKWLVLVKLQTDWDEHAT